MFGNLLAQELGIETFAPAFVEIGSLCANLMNQRYAQLPEFRQLGIQVQPGLAAGCEFHPNNLVSPDPLNPLTSKLAEQAIRIYAFDLMVENPDRKADHKPNCAVVSERLVAYDFELSFSFLLPIIGGNRRGPWEVSYTGIGCKHLFYHALRSCKKVDWQPFLSSLSSLTDQRLATLASGFPPAWTSWAQTVTTRIAAVRNRQSDFALELERSLKWTS